MGGDIFQLLLQLGQYCLANKKNINLTSTRVAAAAVFLATLRGIPLRSGFLLLMSRLILIMAER